MDLKNSPDYIMLYGVDIEKNSCNICIEYDDNRRKGRGWKITLNNNDFVMFPSTQKYFLTFDNTKQSSFILTTTYTYF